MIPELNRMARRAIMAAVVLIVIVAGLIVLTVVG